MLTFINEKSQLSDISITPHTNYLSETSDNLILVNMPHESNFMKQISGIHKKLNKEGRHPVGRNGVYHILGLVKFIAYKWLNMIKLRENEPGRIQVLTYALPTTYSKSMVKDELFSIQLSKVEI